MPNMGFSLECSTKIFNLIFKYYRIPGLILFIIAITIAFDSTYIFNEKKPKVKNCKYFDHR